MLRDKMTVLGLLVHVTSYYDLLSEIINLALCWPRDTHPKLQTIVNKSYLRTHGDGQKKHQNADGNQENRLVTSEVFRVLI